ncbi:hypothetical protein GQ43DRAFT_442126 [Delitschia confertaspora ATCC 74209]|uniref:Uncharacterized protein n=1 Tax=Delitschia confertaspora ATCC 74209 TaxID=1513339 RepID=A0A9P4MU85_9PLEO|nr:hypothetical protein GQ43DRAFT_442126 [Delitschia confertaspora ATCC 74209]
MRDLTPLVCAMFTGVLGTNHLFPPGRSRTRQQNILFYVYIAAISVFPIVIAVGLALEFALERGLQLPFQVLFESKT